MSVNAHHRRHAKRSWPSAAAIATLAVLGSSLAFSQAVGQTQPPANGPQAASTADISDQQLKAAATAIPEVEGIRQNYQQQLAEAPDSDKPHIQNQAGDEMKKAIADQGLSIPEYNSILQAAEENAEVRTRLIQQMPEPDQPPGP